jgi:hypothetical protein
LSQIEIVKADGDGRRDADLAACEAAAYRGDSVLNVLSAFSSRNGKRVWSK